MNARKSSPQNFHHFLSFATTPQQASYDLHCKGAMVEKILKPWAQVIQPWFTIWRQDKTVLWAFAVTGKEHFTFQAVTR